MEQENKVFTKEILQQIEDSLIQKHDRLLDLAALDAIPTEILTILKPHIQKSIALSAITSPRILIDLTNSKHVEVRQELARNSFILSEVLIILSNDKDKNVLQQVKKNLRTPGEVLPKLYGIKKFSFKKQRGCIVERMAHCPYTDPAILKKLSKNEDRRVSCYVAANPNTPIKTLQTLANHRNEYIVKAVALNSNTPIETLQILAEKSNSIEIHYAFNRRKYKSQTIKAENTSKLKCDESMISMAFANNFRFLFNFSYRKVMDCLAQNHNFSGEIINMTLSNKNPNIVEEGAIALTKNPNISLSILNKIYRQKCKNKRSYRSRYKKIRRLALNRMITIYEDMAKNPQTSIEDLQEILHHENAEVRHTLKHHPQGIQLLLGRCLKHQNSLNRFLGALHPQLSLSQRKELMNSENQFDRLAIKLNPH